MFNILVFADHPLPDNKVRPYRTALFVEAATSKYNTKIYVISPDGGHSFDRENNVIRPFSFNWGDFNKSQYSLQRRLFRIFKLFIYVAKFIKSVQNPVVFRVSNGYLGMIAALLKRKNDLVVLDCCDFYFDLYAEFGMPLKTIAVPVIRYFESIAIGSADLIYVDTPAQAKYLTTRFSVCDQKIWCIPNGVLLEKYPPVTKKNLDLKLKYNIAETDVVLFYGGDISYLDGIELVIEFIRTMDQKYDTTYKLIIIGKGNQAYIAKLIASAHDLINKGKIIFQEFVPYDQYIKYLSVSDICLAPFKITPTTDNVECGKIITYLLAGKQVIASKGVGVEQLYQGSVVYLGKLDVVELEMCVFEALRRSKIEASTDLQRCIGEQFDFLSFIDIEIEVLDLLTQGDSRSQIYEKLNDSSKPRRLVKRLNSQL